MIDGLITVRSQSTRLREKCFLKFGDGNIIEHLIKRARYYSINPVISTTNNKHDDRIASIANKQGVRVFRGSENDKIKRWYDTCIEYNIDNFVTIDGDDLFFDGLLNIESHKLLVGGKYDMVLHPKKMPFHGCVGYSITKDILGKVCNTKDTNNTDNHWEHINDYNGSKVTHLKTPRYQQKNIRLTLDYEEDYWMLTTVLRLLGEKATTDEILSLFEKNPDLHKINWFKADDYLKGTGGIV
jgi:spore coat polysaccharide biosynthesis protein SpsF